MGDHSIDCDYCGEDLRGLCGGHASSCDGTAKSKRPDVPKPVVAAEMQSAPGARVPGITLDMADAMSKVSPEMLLAFDRMVSDVFQQRLLEAQKVFEDLMLAVAFADPKVLVDTLWMPGSIEKNCTVYDYIALAKQRLCHPDIKTELVPCHDENCDRHGIPHFEEDSCEG
jgi:hypothetical protein